MAAAGASEQVARAPRWPWLVAAFLGGACVMSVELSAVRLLAPWFGTSLVVWTNVIGVLLAALAVGAMLGSRLSRGVRLAGRLGLVLGLAGLTTAALPRLAAPAADWFVPASLSLAEAGGILAWGSLAASACLFVLPALCFGGVGPLAVEGLAREVGLRPGAAGGLVFGSSTLGSLVGTFATTHVLLPELGLQRSFALAAGAALAAAVAVLLARGSRHVPGWLAVLSGAAAALAAWTDEPSGRSMPEGTELVVEVESPYQRLRVTRATFDGGEYRFLSVNEVSDSYQSVWTETGGFLGPGFYYDDFALPAWLARAERPEPRTWRVLVLGLGAGTAWRVLDGALPDGLELELTGIELDPEVIRLGHEHFDLPRDDPRLEILAGFDARTGLRAVTGAFDAIVLDVYANAIEIPAHLSSVEFLREVRARLVPGGWLVANVGAFDLTDPVLETFAATAAEAFGARVLALPVQNARNATVLARSGDEVPSPLDPAFELEHVAVSWLVAPRRMPGGHRWFTARDAEVASDDRNPIEAVGSRGLRRGTELP